MEMQTDSKKVDRRAMRSKRLIIEAWRELLLEKDDKEISVSDIVKRADIGRATFYAHFEDKTDLGKFLFSQLLIQIELEIQAILNECEPEDNHYQQLVPSLAMFRIAQAKHRWFKMNATNPQTGLVMLIPPLVKRLGTHLDALNRPDDLDELPRRMAATYLVSGLIALLTDWVMSDMPVSPEEMNKIYQNLALPTLNRLLGI